MPTIQNYGTVSGALITIDGETRPLKDWCAKLEVPYKTVQMRWTRGERDPDRLFFKPGHKQDSTGAWLFYGSIRDVENAQGRQTDFAMKNILPPDVAAAVQKLADEHQMGVQETIVTLVQHSLKEVIGDNK